MGEGRGPAMWKYKRRGKGRGRAAGFVVRRVRPPYIPAADHHHTHNANATKHCWSLSVCSEVGNLSLRQPRCVGMKVDDEMEQKRARVWSKRA